MSVVVVVVAIVAVIVAICVASKQKQEVNCRLLKNKLKRQLLAFFGFGS